MRTIHSHSGKKHLTDMPETHNERTGHEIPAKALCSPYTWGTSTTDRAFNLRRWYGLTADVAMERAESEPECKTCLRMKAKREAARQRAGGRAMTVLQPYPSADALHADLCLLVAWLAADGADVAEIVSAVEKPWKYAGEIEAARACTEATQ